MTMREEELRAQILGLVKQYHSAAFASKPFQPGISPVPVAGRVFDERELQNLVDASLDFWLTTGRYAGEFERRFGYALEDVHGEELAALRERRWVAVTNGRLRPTDAGILLADEIASQFL